MSLYFSGRIENAAHHFLHLSPSVLQTIFQSMVSSHDHNLLSFPSSGTSGVLICHPECRRSKDPEECVVQDCRLATTLSCGFMGSALKGPRRLCSSLTNSGSLILSQSPRLLLQGCVLIQHTKYGHFGHRKTVSRILEFFLFSLTYFHLKHLSVHF